MDNEENERSKFRMVLNFIRRVLGQKPPRRPGDPFAYRLAPVRRGPRGRSGATVAEIEDDSYRAYPPRRT